MNEYKVGLPAMEAAVNLEINNVIDVGGSADAERLRTLGRELDDAICNIRNCMASPLLIELGNVYTRLVDIQTKFRAAIAAGKLGT